MNYESEFTPEIGEVGKLGEKGNIPTIYQFTTFRSRLEARWAVFFNEAGITWTYEPEQFDLGFARYTPDFHLQCGDHDEMYVEVKPGRPTDEEIRRIATLSLRTGKDVLVLEKLDEEDETSILFLYEFHGGFRGSSQGNYVHLSDVCWTECVTCHGIWVLECLPGFWGHAAECSEKDRIVSSDKYDIEGSRIKAAMRTARNIKLGM